MTFPKTTEKSFDSSQGVKVWLPDSQGMIGSIGINAHLYTDLFNFDQLVSEKSIHRTNDLA